jgi:gamma-glutamylcyclotransferase (GGCT)/AIG2-like uncharacterized protein YtfP
MSEHLVFVYGTLRRGGVRATDEIFPGAKFVGDAFVSGRLYDLGDFPGLLLDESGARRVVGEVYEVDDETLNKLDAIEAPSSYWRKQVEVSVGDKRTTCWVYAPDPKLYDFRVLIESGDWIGYAETKSETA